MSFAACCQRQLFVDHVSFILRTGIAAKKAKYSAVHLRYRWLVLDEHCWCKLRIIEQAARSVMPCRCIEGRVCNLCMAPGIQCGTVLGPALFLFMHVVVIASVVQKAHWDWWKLDSETYVEARSERYWEIDAPSYIAPAPDLVPNNRVTCVCDSLDSLRTRNNLVKHFNGTMTRFSSSVGISIWS
jgi:hypothetical protein